MDSSSTYFLVLGENGGEERHTDLEKSRDSERHLAIETHLLLLIPGGTNNTCVYAEPQMSTNQHHIPTETIPGMS